MTWRSGSSVGQDRYFQPNQAVAHLPYVEELLESATGKDKEGNVILTPADLSRISSIRRAEARAKKNPEFTLNRFHRLFGSSKYVPLLQFWFSLLEQILISSSTLLTIFGGRQKDLGPLLMEERIPEGWEPRIMAHYGLTMVTFNRTVLKVENGIDEKKVTSTTGAASSSSAPKSDVSTSAGTW